MSGRKAFEDRAYPHMNFIKDCPDAKFKVPKELKINLFG